MKDGFASVFEVVVCGSGRSPSGDFKKVEQAFCL
jgi:hypothetical protein